MNSFPPLAPPWWLRNGHANTIYSYLRPRRTHLPPAQDDWVPVAQGVDLLLRSHWQRHPAPALLLVHGLEGSSEAGYMLTTARLALERGWHVARMNVRGCGDGERRCVTLYNSGMSADVGAALEWVLAKPGVTGAALAGFSMGGNLVLKYAGEAGTDAPDGLGAVAAVSPCLDLDACAAALHRRANWIYEWRFLVNLKERLRRHAVRFPGRYPVERLRAVRSVHEFDDAITAPFTGYQNAADYYDQASAAHVLSNVRVPTLVLHAEDDPFIVITPESRARLAANPAIRFVITAHGGHCSFINRRRNGDEVYWGEARVVQFCSEQCGVGPEAIAPVPVAAAN